jgi:hypothetical protein
MAEFAEFLYSYDFSLFLCIDVFRSPFKGTVAQHTVLYEGKTGGGKNKSRDNSKIVGCVQ